MITQAKLQYLRMRCDNAELNGGNPQVSVQELRDLIAAVEAKQTTAVCRLCAMDGKCMNRMALCKIMLNRKPQEVSQ